MMLISLLSLLLSICITCNSYIHNTRVVSIITHTNKDFAIKTRLNSSNKNNNNDDEILEYDYSTGIVMKKKVNGQYKKRDDRESLPFSIIKTENNIEISLGIWHLDASTSNGDILALGKKGTYVVDKVSYLYKFTGSSFKVFKKKLSVTSINSPWNNEINNDTILQ